MIVQTVDYLPITAPIGKKSEIDLALFNTAHLACNNARLAHGSALILIYYGEQESRIGGRHERMQI